MSITEATYTESAISRKREAEIMDRKRERLHILQSQQATFGLTTPPHIEVEISTIKKELDAYESIQIQHTSDFQTEQVASPIAHYDEFFKLFFSESSQWEGEPRYFSQRLLNNLARACRADGALIVRFNGINWEITETSHKADHKSKDEFLQYLLHRTLMLLSESSSQSIFSTNNMLKGTHPNGKIYTCSILPGTTPNKAVVIYGLKNPHQIDAAFTTSINTIFATTHQGTIYKPIELIEMATYNALKLQFLHVSDYVYHRQFDLFCNQLKRMIVYFEPIIALGSRPYISRWEALARDPAIEPKKAPAALFQIAEQWGRKFQLELDIHFLQTAIASYYSSRRNSSSPIALGELPGLAVNVYPESLVRSSFQKIIAEIDEKHLFPLDKLIFEISEKLPLPSPSEPSCSSEHIAWFRKQLEFYTSYGISFAIDDFGVGHASTSRLSRLEPEFVKVDRDALLHHLGNFTLEYARNLVGDSMNKMKMIVEGFDDQSKFTLAQLYKLKIRYVQGHLLGHAQEQIYDLTAEEEQRIAALLR